MPRGTPPGRSPAPPSSSTSTYVGALALGEFADLQAEITRATRSLVFLRGTMRVGDRTVATADGVWKILAWRGEPFVPG